MSQLSYRDDASTPKTGAGCGFNDPGMVDGDNQSDSFINIHDHAKQVNHFGGEKLGSMFDYREFEEINKEIKNYEIHDLKADKWGGRATLNIPYVLSNRIKRNNPTILLEADYNYPVFEKTLNEQIEA